LSISNKEQFSLIELICVVSGGIGDFPKSASGRRVEGRIHAARRCVLAKLFAAV
jgi:hypothetical protein